LWDDVRGVESQFAQQSLPYWQPIVIPRAILPFHFIFGLCFVSVGILITVLLAQNAEVVLNYTNCDLNATSHFTTMPSADASVPALWRFDNDTRVCTIQFTLEQPVEGPLQMFYQLTNFYQNYRSYIMSECSEQFLGGDVMDPNVLSSCAPLVNPVNSTLIYYPCGLVANSMFNDTLSNLTDTAGGIFPFSESGLASPAEYQKYGRTTYVPDADGVYRNITPPPEWTQYDGEYTVDNIPDLSVEEHFIVWMRISSSASFRKLYGKAPDTLPAGTYTMNITSIYEVRSFYGTKSVVFQHLTWLEGVGPNMGYAYLTVGSVMLATGSVLVLLTALKPRKIGDPALLSWNRQ